MAHLSGCAGRHIFQPLVPIRAKLWEPESSTQCEVVMVREARAASTDLLEQALWARRIELRIPLVVLLVELVAVEVTGLESKVITVAEECLAGHLARSREVLHSPCTIHCCVAVSFDGIHLQVPCLKEAPSARELSTGADLWVQPPR